MVCNLDICCAVGFANDFDFLSRRLVCMVILVLRVEYIEPRVRQGRLKLCVKRIENSPDGGGAIDRGILISTCFSFARDRKMAWSFRSLILA